MELSLAASLLTALGHPSRLAVFRLLMRHMPQEVRPSELAATLVMKPNTLSHHLSDLEQAGLILSRRDGRSIFYSVALPQVRQLLDFLALDCCRGRPDLCNLLQPDTAMSQTPYNVLFICSGNSARSIFAEAILRDLGTGHFTAFSAGTRPGTQLNPFALEVLKRNDHDVSTMRSKHVSEFQAPDAPVIDFVFTVCDTSADEECPPWPGQPITGHWGLPDPVKATGTDAEKALCFAQTYAALRRRIEAFIALPFPSLDRMALQSRVDRIGNAVPQSQEG